MRFFLQEYGRGDAKMQFHSVQCTTTAAARLK